jgi:hypothetical protein
MFVSEDLLFFFQPCFSEQIFRSNASKPLFHFFVLFFHTVNKYVLEHMLFLGNKYAKVYSVVDECHLSWKEFKVSYAILLFKSLDRCSPSSKCVACGGNVKDGLQRKMNFCVLIHSFIHPSISFLSLY